MNTSPVPATESTLEPTVDPIHVLESITAELEALRHDAGFASSAGLIDLHGALYLYALDGDASRIPAVRSPFGTGRILQARIAWSARRLARAKSPDVALDRAAATIEELLHLIDPDLRYSVDVAA